MNALSILNKYFKSRREIAALYLFGSRAARDKRGWKTKPDIDLAILLDHKILPSAYQNLKFEYQINLERLLPEEKIDLVILNRTDLSFCHEIFRNRTILMERHPSQRVEFEARREVEYFDFLPYQRMFAKEILGINLESPVGALDRDSKDGYFDETKK